MQNEAGQITFRILDGNNSLPPPGSALEEWYIKVRDTKLAEMELEDLARACRQDLYDEEVVPLCLMKLEEDPLAGALYDGELTWSLKKGVSSEYWRTHPVEKERFLKLAERGYQENGDKDLIVTEDDLLRK